MVSIAFLRSLSTDEMFKVVLPGASFRFPDGVTIRESATHVRLAIYKDLAIIVDGARMNELAWGLGYDIVFGPETVDVKLIDISTGGFEIRIYEREGLAFKKEPSARVCYPYGLVKLAVELVSPIQGRDAKMYVLARDIGVGLEAGPLIIQGEKGATLVWPAGQRPELRPELEESEQSEDVIERWARELGVIE